MKLFKIVKTTVAFALVFFGLTQVSIAQKNVIQVRPFSTKIGYERMLGERVSGQIMFKFLPTNFDLNFNEDQDPNDESTEFDARFYSVSPEIKFFMNKKNPGTPEGFYIATYLRGGGAKFTAKDNESTDTYSVPNAGIGAVLGWQWIMDNGFTIGTAFGWGVDRFYLNDTDHEDLGNLNVNIGLPKARFSLGYAF